MHNTPASGLIPFHLLCISPKVRRSAEIAFGDPFLEEYLDLKNYQVNPQREAYGWTSNNSVRASILLPCFSRIESTALTPFVTPATHLLHILLRGPPAHPCTFPSNNKTNNK